jgi:rhodanese-related sulfurtransferase
MMKAKLIFLLFVSISLAACAKAEPTQSSQSITGKEIAVEGGSYTDVSASELNTMLENKDFVFVNVHVPFEGNIAGTDLSIPYDQIADNLDQLPADKDAKIVLYCRSDHMSRIASTELVGMGYTNIWNLDGGMVAWEQAGLDIER